MLTHLSIRHYALIDHLEIDLSDGLNIITGETGSGKSIILGALSLILGERAEKRVVKEGQKKCIVEGAFKLDAEKWKAIFDSSDLDFEVNSTLRREVLASGKSRAFINDTPVNLKLLREIALELVDIHSQHQTIQLNNPEFQLGVIDSYAKAIEEKRNYVIAFNSYSAAQKRLKELQASLAQDKREMDFVAFQLNEFEEINLDQIEENELEEEYNMLSNSEEIAQKLHGAVELLNEGESPILSNLKEVGVLMEEISEYSNAYRDLSQRIKSAIIELDDVVLDAQNASGDIEMNPKRLAQLDTIRSVIFRLEQKHSVLGVESLKAKRDELAQRISGSENLEEEIVLLTKEVTKGLVVVRKVGELLSNKRKASSSEFTTSLELLLGLLNMKKASFELHFEEIDSPAANGFDKLEMRFSANPGRKPEPLKNVASGGELSRLMLSIKKLSASQGRTIILDEIDTGVSGEVANSMGRIMKEMGVNQQVISITHLPQIASKGETHFKVFKEESDRSTKTRIERLDEKERVVEIAQMLSGAETTTAAMDNARDLLLAN
ncbi:MAG: DNA repair protein RecN (Recombination protein N) [Cryomorphaceae bacterium]|jgi:DNA repair protein RecN (Recombination protein N)